MKMVTRTAIANMKYHKSKNILTGIAIFLTTILLFIVPSIGMDSVDIQFAMVNQTYPTWHALFRSVDADTAAGLMAHHDIETGGLRCDAGTFYHDDADITVTWMDSAAQKLYRAELSEGTFPEKADELVISEGMLKEFGISGGIGTRITLPFQKYLPDGVDFAADREFTICGFLPDNEANLTSHTYMALVSEAFLNREIPEAAREYRFLFRIADTVQPDINLNTAEEIILAIGKSFDIPETDTNINMDYLLANYVDSSLFMAIVIIILVIIAAGTITIYSIYYVSMAQRVQEFGCLTAVGATKRQIRQIVLREGLCTACIAIPLGLAVSTLLIKPILILVEPSQDPLSARLYCDIIGSHEIALYKWQFYLLAIVITFLTVYLSLFLPMRRAQNISAVEAMRYQSASVKQSDRKGQTELSIGRLARTNLTGNKKRSLITILSVSITGILVITAATVLSCADPKESADSDIYGQYQLSLNDESGNREHPEREWTRLIQDNPLSEELKEQIDELDGVEQVVESTLLNINTDLENVEQTGVDSLLGLPKSCFPELKKGIMEGDASWEELVSGDNIILHQAMLRWYPDLKVGDTIQIQVQDGEQELSRTLKIIAIGDYPFGLTGLNFLLTSKDAADRLTNKNCTGYFHIIADKSYDEALENSLRELMGTEDLLELDTWKRVYDDWERTLEVLRNICFAFLGILSFICIMNLINTMINSIHIRKKELGIMQAIGMTNVQMSKMLRLEGLFYILGTLFISVAGGSLLGYAVYLWAKQNHMFSITRYHFPAAAVSIMIAVMILVQLILTALLVHSVKKESLIERIRFSE